MPSSALHPRRTVLSLLALVLLPGCGAGSAPSASVPTSTAPAPQPAVDPASVDWKPIAYEALGCHSREQWIADGLLPESRDDASYEVVGGEVVGDGNPDAIVTIACPYGMGMGEAGVLVFDRVADDAEVVAVLHGELRFQVPTTTVEDGTVMLEGPTVAGDDPLCCAGHWGRAEYRWVDGGFALVHQVEAFTDGPISYDGLPDGSHVAILRAVDDREVVVDLVEWLEGDAAVAACAEDGQDSPVAQAMCRMFHVREGDRHAHALRVSDRATISWIDASGEERPAARVTDLRSTDSISDGEVRVGLFDVTVQDGVVVDLQERFTP